MLQQMTTDRIERFYKDVGTLRLKFPVAEISRATGQSKGNVSKYLSQTLEPSNAFLDRFYKAYAESFKKVSRATTATETPQIRHQEKDNELKGLLRLIQFKTGKTIEEVASDINYARPYLTNEANRGENPKLIKVLTEKYKDFISDELTSSTKAPVFEMKPTNGNSNGKDQVISQLVNNETKLIDTNKNQQETIGKLTDLVTKLVEKR